MGEGNVLAMVPWEILLPVIESGIETLEVELKEELTLRSQDIIEDVVAMANTGKRCFIVIGVINSRHRTPGEIFKEFFVENPNDFQVSINQRLTSFLDPPVAVRYHQEKLHHHPIGIIEIPVSEDRPHLVSSKGVILIRSGGHKRPATQEEISKMYEKRYLARFAEIFAKEMEDVLSRNNSLELLCKNLAQKLYHKLSRDKRREEILDRFKSFNLEELLQRWQWEEW